MIKYFIALDLLIIFSQKLTCCHNSNILQFCHFYIKNQSVIIMTEGSFGRIVSQKKTLLKYTTTFPQFDPHQQIKLHRISHPTNKYIQQNNDQLSNQLINITNKQIKKRYHRGSQELIFRNSNDDVQEFRRKVKESNTNIDYKLKNLQIQISKLKTQKIIKAPLDLHPSKPEHPPSLKNSIKDQNFNINNQNLLNISLGSLQQHKINISHPLSNKNHHRIYSHYKSFINKLKQQILLDIDFTNMLLCYSNNDLQNIAKYITDNYGYVDPDYFTISPIEQDPLQSQTIKTHQDEIKSISHQLYRSYLKIQQHFNTKLLHCFDQQTILNLFEEIGENQITLGHLTSYINLKTSCQFRNRNLIKLLKRIGNTNQNLQINKRKFVKIFAWN